MTTSPTIYALSSGEGRAGIAVIRISGPAAFDALARLSGRNSPPRRLQLATLRNPSTNDVIDRGLVLTFPAPASFTGEDIVELHIHGSPAIVRRMLQELALIDGLVLAQPGEFTQRAFINGKMDLTEVEGLADLIAADTELQRLQAMAQSSGVLRKHSEHWRKQLIHALALIEAVLDFSDEPDVTGAPVAEAVGITKDLQTEIAQATARTKRAETIRNGFQIAIVGSPNVGKSSLLNALAARDVAIVTDEAGTTRDTLEVRLDLKGMAVTLIDTAGLRNTGNVIEREGIRRTHRAAQTADLVLHLSADDEPPSGGTPATFTASDVIHVRNKSDLRNSAVPLGTDHPLHISAKTGEGLDDLLEVLTEHCLGATSQREPPIVTRERQRLHLEQCLAALDSFNTGDRTHLELRAEDLRQAAVSLGRLTGQIDAEDVLDDIFAGFCIGK